MPEYLSPGVYVEEVSFRAKFIEGVSTSTAGMVGQATFGPTSGLPELVTSFTEFRRRFGGWDDLKYADGETTQGNYTAHGVRAFFDNGGQRLYVARVFVADAAKGDGQASLPLPGAAGTAQVRARYPGSWGNRLRVSIKLMPRKSTTNLIAMDTQGQPVLRGVYKGAMVQTSDTPASDALALGVLPTDANASLLFVDQVDGVTSLVDASGAKAAQLPKAAYLVELQVQVFVGDSRVPESTYNNLSPGPAAGNFIGTYLDPDEPVDSDAQIVLTGVDPSSKSIDAVGLLKYLLGSSPEQGFTGTMTGGNDGVVPQAMDYKGMDDDLAPTGLAALGRVGDISLVLAPDAAAAPVTANAGVLKYSNHIAINNELISHCEQMRYRFAILDEPGSVTSSVAQQFRGQFDSSYAAIYYPWVSVVDPRPEKNGRLLTVPPSGAMAGVFARTDVRRGVWKAPANEVVSGAVDFEVHVTRGVQDVLNPAGINCLRFFEDGGYRVWGARTMSSDPEWKYINVRRLFLYMEHSIDRGTQWVVFEPNNERTWANVRHTIEAFLLDLWKAGALMGTRPEEAFFVRCDRTTMSQNDLDNGRLICLVGVAPAYPAEFVIFRIGQWTGDAKAA
jgi:phage tail sheath protein FI